MGAGNSTMSTAINDITNKTINNISTSIKNSCIINSNNIQTIDLKLNKIKGCSLTIENLSQSINATTTMDCKNSSIDTTELQNTLKNNLEAAASTVKDSPFFSFGETASAEAINIALNEITNDVNISKIAETISNSLNNQNIVTDISEFRCLPYKTKTGDIMGTEINIKNLNQDIMNNVVLNALTENQSIIQAVTAIDNSMKTSAESVSLGLSAAVFAILGPLIFGFIIFIIIFVVGGKVLSSVMRAKSAIASKFVSKPVAFGKSGFGSTKSKTPMILFFVFTFVSMILFVTLSINIGKVKDFSKSTTTYYLILGGFITSTIITCVMFLLYIKSESKIKLGVLITFAILTAGLASMGIALTQIEINELENLVSEYSTPTREF